jgi:hypothetical protein
MVSFTLLPLYTRGNLHRYSLKMRLGRRQSRSGHFRREKSYHGRPGHSLSLYRLNSPTSAVILIFYCIVTCQRIARERLNKHPAIRSSNKRTNIYNSLLGNIQRANELARQLSRDLFFMKSAPRPLLGDGSVNMVQE